MRFSFLLNKECDIDLDSELDSGCSCVLSTITHCHGRGICIRNRQSVHDHSRQVCTQVSQDKVVSGVCYSEYTHSP